MTIIIPNRPSGNDSRVIADIMENLGVIRDSINPPGLDGGLYVANGAFTADKLDDELRRELGSNVGVTRRVYATASNEVSTTNTTPTAVAGGSATVNVEDNDSVVFVRGFAEIKSLNGNICFAGVGRSADPPTDMQSLSESKLWQQSLTVGTPANSYLLQDTSGVVHSAGDFNMEISMGSGFRLVSFTGSQTWQWYIEVGSASATTVTIRRRDLYVAVLKI
jgi:hypothetical protein